MPIKYYFDSTSNISPAYIKGFLPVLAIINPAIGAAVDLAIENVENINPKFLIYHF